jgi:hypothetical protein
MNAEFFTKTGGPPRLCARTAVRPLTMQGIRLSEMECRNVRFIPHPDVEYMNSQSGIIRIFSGVPEWMDHLHEPRHRSGWIRFDPVSGRPASNRGMELMSRGFWIATAVPPPYEAKNPVRGQSPLTGCTRSNPGRSESYFYRVNAGSELKFLFS